MSIMDFYYAMISGNKFLLVVQHKKERSVVVR